MSEIVNKVAESEIQTIDLEELYPSGELVEFDLKPFLFQEMVLREKEFRAALKQLDWSIYEGKHVAVTCSVEAIIPTWAYMLVMTYLVPVSKTALVGTQDALKQHLFFAAIESLDAERFRGKPIVVKGCSRLPVPLFAYGQLVSRFQGIARSIMFGEPCSTVPLWKQPRQQK